MSAFLADLVLLAHLAFIGFAVFGALLALRWAWAPAAHLPALAWAAYVELSSGVCPLTPIEQSLRLAAGEAGYAASFVEHYLSPFIYPPGLTAGVQLWLGVGLLGFNLLLYTYVLLRLRLLPGSGRLTSRCS